MNLDPKFAHIFLSDLNSLRDESSISIRNNSLSLPNFQSVQINPSHNVSDYSIGSEQTFRQSRAPSPPKDASPKLYSEIKQRVQNSAQKSTSPYKNVSPGRSFNETGSFKCSPMKKKITAEIQARPPAYLPLSEKLSLTKEELSEKSKELQEVRELNLKLASQVKSYREKENKLVGEVENKSQRFNIDVTKLNGRDIVQKYQELLNDYRQLLQHSAQVEESLRLETLRGEEQRAYISVLKQKTDLGLPDSPFLKKNLQGSTAISSLKSTVRYAQRPEDLEQRVSELVETESALNDAIEDLKSELKGVSDSRDALKTQMEEHKAEASQKQNEFDQIINENVRLANENKALQENNNSAKLASEKDGEKVEKERESLLETLREREVMINELTQENGRLSQEVIKYGKALSDINQKVSVKMKDYELLKGNTEILNKELAKEKNKVVHLECDVKEREERLKEQEKARYRRESTEREDTGKNKDVEEVRKENKILLRKVNILAERVGELKEFESKHSQALEHIKDIGKTMSQLVEGKGDDKLTENNGDKIYQMIVESVGILSERMNGKAVGNKTEGLTERDKVSMKEVLRWKEEADRLNDKVKLLVKEKEVLNETQEQLYEILSKSEIEIDILKKRLEEKDKNTIESEYKDKLQNEEVVSFLQEEVKIKQEEIEKLKGFIFNTEVKELVEEGIQATREMLKLEKNLGQKNRPISRREEGVKKIKENLDSIRAKRKVLEEEVFSLWNCEKKKYENLSKLEQQNFQLQNEISRLMNELEINFSKYGENAGGYYSIKQSEKPAQYYSGNSRDGIRESQRRSPDRVRASIHSQRKSLESEGLNQSKIDESFDRRNNLPLAADISRARKKRVESEERV